MKREREDSGNEVGRKTARALKEAGRRRRRLKDYEGERRRKGVSL